MKRRLALLTLGLLGLGWTGFLAWLAYLGHLRQLGERPEFVRHPYATSASCRQCHAQVYDQWARSPHAHALESLAPRAMDPSDKEVNCRPCHVPQPVLEQPPGLPPLARLDHSPDGVSCATCHQQGEGFASLRSGLRGACNPIHQPRLASVDLCLSCHNAHGTVDQWRASRYAAQGKDCRSCHSDHVMAGAHDTEALRGALQLGVERRDGSLWVGVTNRGAGHNIPSGRRSRSLVLIVDFPDGRQERFLFRNPFRGEDGPNTQLQSGETRWFTYPLPAGGGRVRVRLLYQFRPSQPDDLGVPLLEQEL